MSLSSPKLKKLQQEFFDSLRDENSMRNPLHRWIRQSCGLARDIRMGVYVYAYYARLVDVLKQDFEHTVRLLGVRRFEKVAKDFVRRRPSRFANLSELGEAFPHFVSKQRLPSVIKELAAHVWEVSKAYYVDELRDELKSHLEVLAAKPKLEFRFVLDPSVKIFRSQFNLRKILKGGRKIERIAQILLVYRNREGFGRTQELCEGRSTLFRAIQRGTSLSKISSNRKLDPKIVRKAFEEWSQGGIIRQLSRAKSK